MKQHQSPDTGRVRQRHHGVDRRVTVCLSDGRFVGREKIDSDGLRVRPLVVGGWLYAFGNSGKLVALTIR